ncbi:MAG TPA: cupin domain-containing protein [Planctomycetota bacterium]
MSERFSRASLAFEGESGIDFLWEPLGLQGHGISVMRFQPGEGQPFWHHHERQEEVYVGIRGVTTIRIDEQELQLAPGDAVRVEAAAVRAVGNTSVAACAVLVTGGLPLDEPRTGSNRGALLRDGSRVKELGVPDWGPKAPA